ncbi:MAG: hypothetical protein AAF489_04415 [Bacteroidota bacterium]
MKKLLLLLFLLFTASSIAQFSWNDEGELIFKKVYELDRPKAALKEAASKWLALTFKNSKNVIRHDTENSIIGKGTFSIIIHSQGYDFPGSIDFVIDLAFKEGRYKLELYDYRYYTDAYDQIKSPIIDSESYSFERHREFTRQQIDIFMPEGSPGRRIALKRLENPKKSKADYEMALEKYRRMHKTTVSKSKALISNLVKYLANAEEDDW